MIEDASSFVCSAARVDALVRGAVKPWLLGLLGVGIGIELGSLDTHSDTDPDSDSDSDDKALPF